jgi:site-specific recombinase XerD
MDNAKALQRFKAYLRRRYPGRRTPIDYVSDIRQFQRSCSKSWDTVTVEDIDQFVDQMHRRNLKPATVTRRVMALKVYFDFLANDTGDFNHANPVLLKRHAAKLGRHLPRDLSDADATRLWNVIESPRDRALVALMWHAGLRVSEVVGLTLDDVIPFAAAEAVTSRLPAYLRVLGKGQKERVVYLNQETFAVLNAWLTVRPPVTYRVLFVNDRGNPLGPSGVQWLLNAYGEKLGLHLTPHRLRHTFARQLIEAQMPVESLASLMGHAQISTTQIYLAGADPATRQIYDQAMQRLENAVPNPPKESAPSPTTSPPMKTKSVRPVEPRYPTVPDGAAWATDLPEAIRQACLAHLQRLSPHWRVSYRAKHARWVLWEFEQFFRFALKRHPMTTVFELTLDDLRAYIDDLQKRAMKGGSVRARLHYPLSLLRTLADQGQPISPALLRVERPPLTDPLPRALSELDAQRLEAHACRGLDADTPEAAQNAACYFLLAHTGIRTCELLDLRQEDIDLEQRRLWIRHGKQERERVVYLTEKAAQAVRQYLERSPHSKQALLLVDDQGDPLSAIWLRTRIQQLGKTAGVPTVTPHRLRHTLATRLINQGVPITTIQKLLGHRFLSTTQRYARVYDATVERDYRMAMQRLEQNKSIPVPLEWFQRTAASPEAIQTSMPSTDSASRRG